jgi:RND family efflux transporter MFP subunit
MTRAHSTRIPAAAIAAITIAAAAAGTSGCTRVEATEPTPLRPVKVMSAAAVAAPAAPRYSATIEPFQQLALSFKAAGYVDHVAARPGPDGRARAAQAGDRIAKGMLLARVRTADYRERVGQARARLAEGQAGVVKARADLDRATALFGSQSLTRPDLDAAQAAFDAAAARLTGAQAEVELAESALRDCALVAPAAGVLIDRRIEVGALVGTGSVGFTLADVAAVKARFGVPDTVVGRAALGTPIAVTVDGVAGRTFTGRVTAVAPVADAQSRVFDVEVTIPNGEGALRPGMIGTVAFAPAAPASAAAGSRGLPVVPLGAIVTPATGQGYAVLVVERGAGGDVARFRRIELGDVIGNGVAVVRGLALGDRIVVTGAGLLADGDPVRVIP